MRDEWGNWLETLPWTDWCTFTWRWEPSEDSAWRSWRRWIARTALDGIDLPYFAALETGTLGRIHIHALLARPERIVTREQLWASWFKTRGRAQLLPFDKSKGGSWYVSKYCVKEMNGSTFTYDVGFPEKRRIQLNVAFYPKSLHGRPENSLVTRGVEGITRPGTPARRIRDNPGRPVRGPGDRDNGPSRQGDKTGREAPSEGTPGKERRRRKRDDAGRFA